MQATATRMLFFDPRVHILPFCHVVVADTNQVGSGARIAIITVTDPDLNQAMTILEIARPTQVTVPLDIDRRGLRCAST